MQNPLFEEQTSAQIPLNGPGKSDFSRRSIVMTDGLRQLRLCFQIGDDIGPVDRVHDVVGVAMDHDGGKVALARHPFLLKADNR